MKPKTIKRENIPYIGARARGNERLRYTVTGRGGFPDDMLRYDAARALSPVETEGRDLRSVRIVDARGCTPARWNSFGWSVHDDIEAYLP